MSRPPAPPANDPSPPIDAEVADLRRLMRAKGYAEHVIETNAEKLRRGDLFAVKFLAYLRHPPGGSHGRRPTG